MAEAIKKPPASTGSHVQLLGNCTMNSITGTHYTPEQEKFLDQCLGDWVPTEEEIEDDYAADLADLSSAIDRFLLKRDHFHRSSEVDAEIEQEYLAAKEKTAQLIKRVFEYLP
ncbi:MAG: hypothetical protein F6J97_00870 [Leptolyngbya sp. SIO4C1]|nr:hypothetical protein [Leptolyngbya sp. SIO4C1]